MQRHPYFYLIKTVLRAIILCVFVPLFIYLVCSFFIDGKIHGTSTAALAICAILYFLADLVGFWLNRKSKKRLVFEEDTVYCNGKSFDKSALRMRYFGSQVSLIWETLVIPKLYINGIGRPVTCYLPRKDIEKLKRMNYSITLI